MRHSEHWFSVELSVFAHGGACPERAFEPMNRGPLPLGLLNFGQMHGELNH